MLLMDWSLASITGCCDPPRRSLIHSGISEQDGRNRNIANNSATRQDTLRSDLGQTSEFRKSSRKLPLEWQENKLDVRTQSITPGDHKEARAKQ